MLWMLIVALVLLWAIGMLTALTLGGLLHLLLAAAVALAAWRVWRSHQRRAAGFPSARSPGKV
jgi:hypothetical protein